MVTNYIGLRNNPVFREFRNYVLSFYGYDGIYPIAGLNVAKVEVAIMNYIEMCSNERNRYEWGDGDSIDRERVRDIILEGA